MILISMILIGIRLLCPSVSYFAEFSYDVLMGRSSYAKEPEQPMVPLTSNADENKRTENHHFGVLKLQGKLRKPKINNYYIRKGLRMDKVITIPENFNEQIISDASQF